MSKLARKRLTIALAVGYTVLTVLIGGGHSFLHDHGSHEHGTAEHDAHGHDHAAADVAHTHSDADLQSASCESGLPESDPTHSDHDESHCWVCQYLATASLPVTITTLPAAPEWRRPYFCCETPCPATVFAAEHPARGPPLSA
ncbi:MAG: hypothetical protein K8T25_13415 [Planctomycetia bacterium]|nr:hypothetical protein [Planctomycetia bacterium]